MILKSKYNPIRILFKFIWVQSELKNIPPLGFFAPYVFGLMIGAKYMKRVKKIK